MKDQVARIMPDDDTKKKWRRIARRRRKEAQGLTKQADQQIEKLLIRRFDRLVSVRRFIFLWVALFVLLFFATVVQIRALSKYYQTLQPVAGGLYNEGLIGNFTNANPLYSNGTADTAASRLVFSGLFKYDTRHQLVGALATGYEISPNGRQYTVSLRQGVQWHDGEPFTADDVIFTYQMISDIETQSYLYSSWQGTKVTKKDSMTVIFDLPSQLAAFPHAMTNGIIPKHLLKDTPPGQMRSASFNTSPVGTGPFKWKFVEVSGVSAAERQQLISLAANSEYWEGRPKLDGFSIIVFTNDIQMVKAYREKRINAMSGLETVPAELAERADQEVYLTPLTASVMTFFNNSRPILSDANIRRALASGINRSQLIELTKQPSRLANSPILKDQIGFAADLTQVAYNPGQANQLLDQAGWVRDEQGQRAKDGQPLMVSLSSQDTNQYTQVAQFIQNEWAKLGVKTEVRYFSAGDLQGNIIAGHDYDALLYGISIGADPDVYAYWHSTQASVSSQGRLNLSEYKSAVADRALESGRTRSEPDLRALKYREFLQVWVNDVPAVALYQPNFLYISRTPIAGYERKAANTSADRFYNVHNWMVRQERRTIQ